MEQNTNGRPGSCPESYIDNNDHPETLSEKGVCIDARILHECISTIQRTAVCEARMYSGVRGAPRQHLAGGAVYSMCALHEQERTLV